MGDDLSRGLGLVHVYAISTGAMFSSGFFLLPGLAAGETGPSTPLAYLLAGLLVVPAMLSAAELATAFPRAGGPYHFLQRSLGTLIAIIGALGLFVAMVLKAAFALVGIGAYLSIVIDVPVEPVAVGLALLFTGLNVVGARESARLQIGLVAVLLAVLAAFTLTGVLEVADRGLGEARDAFSPFLADGPTGVLAATGLVFVSFAGMLQVASVAGEVRTPERTIPRALLLSLGTATAVYVVGTALMVAVVPPDELRDDTTPVATAVESFPLPFGTGLVVAAALAAFASTGNAGIMSAARYPLALARDHLLWRRFARLGRFGTPTASVLTTGASTVVLVLAFDVESIAKLASAFLLVVFALLNLAVVVLRRGRVVGYAPGFRSPLFPVLQGAGIVASVVLVVDLGLMPALFTAGIVAAGTTWYLMVGRARVDDVATVLHLLDRVRTGVPDEEDVRRLQEEGPRQDDHAAEVLEEATVVALPAGSPVDAAVGAAVEGLAERLGVARAEVVEWVRRSPHPVIEIDRAKSVLHQVLLDAADEPAVVLAWAPEAERGGVGGPGHRAAVVVAGPGEQRDRILRLSALLVVQLRDERVWSRWGPDADAADVRHLLATDAAGRQGGEPARAT